MRLLLPALALAATVAGCAGGGERLSRAEFVAQATAICSRAEERVGALPQPETTEEVGTYAREARAITEEGVSALRELEPPEELEDGFDRYLEQADEVVALLGELERSATAGDDAEAQRISGRIQDAAEAGAAARAAGIPECEEAAA